MMIKQPALAPSPQPRPAPTVRALPVELAAQRGPFWMPIRGPNPTPIDMLAVSTGHLRGKLAAIFSCHHTLQMLDDGRNRSNVVAERFAAIHNAHSGLAA